MSITVNKDALAHAEKLIESGDVARAAKRLLEKVDADHDD